MYMTAQGTGEGKKGKQGGDVTGWKRGAEAARPPGLSRRVG